MADYSETFTKVDGHTIEASDFETEFNAIETAIATKADTDSDTLTNLTIGTGYSGSVVISDEANALSGTSLDITGIPSWVKKIRILFNGLTHSSGSGVSFAVQLGDSGGIETSSYVSEVTDSGAGNGSATNCYRVSGSVAQTCDIYGSAELSLYEASTNTWICTSMLQNHTDGETHWQTGKKALSSTLTQVRIAQASTAATLTGDITILYEG